MLDQVYRAACDGAARGLRSTRGKVAGLARFLALRRRVEGGAASWHELRHWSRDVGRRPWLCAPDRVAALVMGFDPELPLARLRDARIIGGGAGAFNLNAFRSGTLDGVRVFEKVYLRDSRAWRRLGWVHGQILPQLGGRVRTPALLHRVEGGRLAAAYFEHVADVTPMPEARLLDAALHLRRNSAHADVSGAGPSLADFRTEPFYAAGAENLRRILAARRNPAQVDRLAASLLAPGGARVFSHGDFVLGNVTAQGVVLDWDRAGAYPPGYDFGWIFGRLLPCANLEAFDCVAHRGAAAASAGAPGSLEFFAAVFYAQRRGVQVTDDLILALFDRACALRGIGVPRPA